LWHYLRDRTNRENKCWPGQRNIALELGCKTHSLRNWTFELVNAGYLEIETKGQNHSYTYSILFGDDAGVMPKWATRKTISQCPKGNTALPKRATPRVAEKGDESNSNGVIKKRNNAKNFFDLPVEKRESLKAQLRAAAENPFTPCDAGEKKETEKKGPLPGERSFVTALESGASDNVLDKLSEPQNR
jgi:hypothetical protein